MSTLAAAADAPLDMDDRPTPFTRLVHVELRKLYNTRAGMWLLITIAGLTAAVLAIATTQMDESRRTFENFVLMAATPQGFLLPVLGILAITSEWSQRTGLVTFTLEPRRGRVLAAKIVAALVVGFVALVLVVALAYLMNAWVGRGGAGITPGVLFDLFVGQQSGVLLGVGFGMLLLNTPAAIVAFFALPLAWSIAMDIGGQRLATIKEWFDINYASTGLFQHTMDADAWMKLGVASLVWIAIPLAIGTWRVLRSEVKSA